METSIPRVLITAVGSGSGKTTLTCAIIKALMNNKLNVAAFKCGPDYIDPMFHSEIIGNKSRNLDLFLMGAEPCKYLLAKNSASSDIAIIEGVMGYYDGMGQTVESSSYEVAKVTSTPTILVINAKGAALSIAAMIKGFKEFRADSNIQGVILNNIGEAVYNFYKDILERECGVKLCGYFPPLPSEKTFAGRHLGLVTAAETANLQETLEYLAQIAEKTIDMQALSVIAKSAPPLVYQEPKISPIADITIAVAKDYAFCFYYQDSLELLNELGAKIVTFSPLNDTELPKCDGLYLGGGYPELYLECLQANEQMRQSIQQAIENKLPTIAECGGFMYLMKEISDFSGQAFAMTGVVNGVSHMTEKLNRFGYVTLTAQHDNMLGKQGVRINAHEFHYSDSDCNGNSYLAQKPHGKRSWHCIEATDTLFAGYPHIHLWGNIEFAKRFVKQCADYRKKKVSAAHNFRERSNI